MSEKTETASALMIAGFIFLGLFFIREIVYLSKFVHTIQIESNLSSFEILFRKVFIGFLADMVTSPSVWLGAVLLFIAHRIKIKGKKSEQN